LLAVLVPAGGAARPPFQVAPHGLHFGKVAIGTTEDLSVTVTNVSDVPISGFTILLTADSSPPSEFNIVAFGCGTLSAGQTCSVTVGYPPVDDVRDIATLVITNLSTGYAKSVAVSGIGFAP
jgi:hypothetical protein